MTAPMIVIGAGVAGCVAARTLADAGHDVVLFEAGPGPKRPAVLDELDHLRTPQAEEWWFPDLPRRGRGLGGGSAVNGMVLDAIHPLDIKRWGWDDALEHQRWILDRWPHSQVPGGRFTEAFGAMARQGFPAASSTLRSGWSGWAQAALTFDGAKRTSAFDAFLSADDERVSIRTGAAVHRIVSDRNRPAVELEAGERVEGSKIFLAAGTTGSPELLVTSDLLPSPAVAAPLNHPSTAIIVELDDSLRHVRDSASAPSSHLLRTVTGLSENTVDLQMLVLDHTGQTDEGLRHGAVIVSALEPDRQKVLVAGITQVLHWLAAIPGVAKFSLSDDQSPVQHQLCSLTPAVESGQLRLPGIEVIDGSVLPALPHTNPMLSIAIGARRAALRSA